MIDALGGVYRDVLPSDPKPIHEPVSELAGGRALTDPEPAVTTVSEPQPSQLTPLPRTHDVPDNVQTCLEQCDVVPEAPFQAVPEPELSVNQSDVLADQVVPAAAVSVETMVSGLYALLQDYNLET
jgi:hypothetical protein